MGSIVNVQLLPFATVHEIEIASWVADLDEARAWSGRDATFPIAVDQFECWHADHDVHPFVALQDDCLVAYGEIWADATEEEIELARIIVSPACRGRGVGRAFVRALVKQAAIFRFADVYLRVVSENLAAIRCYEGAGFTRVSKQDEIVFNQRQPIEYVWLRCESKFVDEKGG